MLVVLEVKVKRAMPQLVHLVVVQLAALFLDVRVHIILILVMEVDLAARIHYLAMLLPALHVEPLLIVTVVDVR